MWYRNVGGVIDNDAIQESHSEILEPSSANDTSQTEVNRAGSPRNDASQCEVASQHESITPEISDTTDADVRKYQSDTVEGGVNRYESDSIDVNFDRYEGNVATVAGLNLNYGSPPDGTDTLFFDGSANIYDLPEGLDWFFDPPELDPLLNVDVQHMQAVPPCQALILSPVSINQQSSAHSSPPLNNSCWSTVQARLIENLDSLPPEILQSWFFYPSNLEKCYELYFDNYHHHFPILHRPTLLVTEAEPLLVASIITLGSTMATDDIVFSIGQKVHDLLRWIIFQVNTRPPCSYCVTN